MSTVRQVRGSWEYGNHQKSSGLLTLLNTHYVKMVQQGTKVWFQFFANEEYPIWDFEFVADENIQDVDIRGKVVKLEVFTFSEARFHFKVTSPQATAEYDLQFC